MDVKPRKRARAATRRTSRRPRRTSYRQIRIPRGPTIYRFKRYATLDVGLPVQAAGTAAHQSFALANCINSLEFTSLFDSYRIDKVEIIVSWSPITNLGSAGTIAPGSAGYVDPSSVTPPVFRYYIDYDDESGPTDSDFRQRQGVVQRRLKPFEDFTITCKPAVLTPVWRGTVAPSGYVSRQGQWLDCANPDIPHLGLKYFVEGVDNGGQVTLRVNYHLSFKQVR